MNDFKDAMASVAEEKVHHFPVQTQSGVAMVKVPHGKMSRCECGSDRFEKVFHVGQMKTQQLGAPPMTLEAPLFVCCACGMELKPGGPKVEDKKLV